MENGKKETPFHVAIASRNHAALKVLCDHIEATEDLNLSSLLHSGRKKRPSPIQLAIKEDNYRVLEVLMAYNLGDLTSIGPHLDLKK